MSTLKSKGISKSRGKQYRSGIDKWVKIRLEERVIKGYELAREAGMKHQILATMLGGEKMLSVGNITRLAVGLIKTGCIGSPGEFQEFLDILRREPGYNLGAIEEEKVVEAARKAFMRQDISFPDPALLVQKLLMSFNEYLLLSNSDAVVVVEGVRQADSKYLPMVHALVALRREYVW